MQELIGSLPSLAAVAGVAYLAVAGLTHAFADRVIFQPPPAGYGPGEPGLVRIETEDGVSLAALYLPNPSAGYTLLHSHGNAEDLGHIRPALEAFRRLGFSVLAYDYRGYGQSGGSPSEAGVYRDIEAAYRYLVADRGVPPERILVHGFSVGSGPSVYLAATRPVAGLVLEAPFTTAFRVVTRVPLLPFDRFPNLARIRDVACPVLIVHGTADFIVPFSHGRRLFAAANEPRRRLWVKGAGHNDLRLVAGPAYGAALLGFVREVVAGGAGGAGGAERRPGERAGAAAE